MGYLPTDFDCLDIDTNICAVNGVYSNLIRHFYEQDNPVYFPAVTNGVFETKVDGVDDNCNIGALIYNECYDYIYRLLAGNNTLPTLNQGLAYIAYLLRTSLCYVEVLSVGTSRVKKMLATSNLSILSLYTDISRCSDADVNLTSQHILSNEVPYLRLNGDKVSKPRKPLEIGGTSIRVVPISLLSLSTEAVLNKLSNGIYECLYIKDNGYDRKIVSTFDKNILSQYYSSDFVDMVLRQSAVNWNTVLERGYIRVPELGVSCFDETGVRALSVAKLKCMTKKDISEVDMSYVNVNFDDVLPYFKSVISSIRDVNLIAVIADSLGLKVTVSQGLAYIVGLIINWAETLNTCDKTQFLRQLYSYMRNNPALFPRYQQAEVVIPSVFNVSCSTMGGTMGVASHTEGIAGGTEGVASGTSGNDSISGNNATILPSNGFTMGVLEDW